MSSAAPQRRGALPRVADGAVHRARLWVVPRLRTRAPRVPFVTLISVLLVAGVVGLLLFNTSMQQASFTASRLEAQAEDLSARQQALAMQVDRLRDPQSLAVKACAQGMVAGPPAAFLKLESGKVIGKPTAAVPGPCNIKPPAPAPPAPPGAARERSTPSEDTVGPSQEGAPPAARR